MARRFLFCASLFILTLEVSLAMGAPTNCGPIQATDTDRIEFALNLEFLEAEFFLNGALGRGLDSFAPSFAKGGPPPTGAKKANLDPLVAKIIEEFGYEEIGHLRAIINATGGIPRPLLDLSTQTFANIFNQAFGFKLTPPFDPYLNTVNYLLASNLIPYVGLVGYVGTIPELNSSYFRRLVAGLLGVEAGQDAVLRALLYERANEKVMPYDITVAEFTNRTAELKNRLAMCGIKDEGIIVPLFLGAENRTNSNILSANTDSLSYSRTPPEILRIVYGTGSENKPGGFYPNGAGGNIARRYLSPA
ncbi:ferritin-like catalase Nec2 [Quercus suber]|uniref:Desiccation-related protein pcc13-62 n=1 Tax=Quercus suber TaxID=58331 RepID=A0AAW0JAL9_QUESU|nr:desiccation-related protein PCC13-62-like [Quercus suber]POE98373.1 desiccation-related protein pcc13-62 [Quercus suber]